MDIQYLESSTEYKVLCTNNKGSALIITLLLISIMVGLVVDFVYKVYIDTASVSNWGNAQQASLLAKSGQTIGTLYFKELKLRKYTDERELTIPVDYDFGPGTSVVIDIEDENAKFNINAIIEENGKTNQEKLSSLKKMLEFLNINPDIALIIADWIDPDSEPRLSNSEDAAKNDYLWSVDELKLIEGLDEHFDSLEPYVTIYKNVGTLVYQVNINTAELPVLLSLHDEMTETLAQNIIDARENFPFENTAEVVNIAGLEAIGTKLGGKTTVKSTNFRITSKATVKEITRIIESVMDTSSNVLFWREI